MIHVTQTDFLVHDFQCCSHKFSSSISAWCTFPVAFDALYQTITFHVTDPNDGDVTQVIEVTFVSWDGKIG